VGFSVSRGLRGAALAALVAAAAAAPASAHHSFAMFDNENQIKIAGTVSEFQWTNPHIYIAINGGKAGEEAKKWTIEGASPGILNRVGWKFNMIKPGDKVVMIVAPMRSGGNAALLKEITLPNGKVMNNGGFAGPAKIH
jgi:hypothetical protein